MTLAQTNSGLGIAGRICECGHADFFHHTAQPDDRCGECDCAEFAYDQEWACTHCGGEGLCYDGADPLGDCPDDMHDCHACRGTGARKDQVLF